MGSVILVGLAAYRTPNWMCHVTENRMTSRGCLTTGICCSGYSLDQLNNAACEITTERLRHTTSWNQLQNRTLATNISVDKRLNMRQCYLMFLLKERSVFTLASLRRNQLEILFASRRIANMEGAETVGNKLLNLLHFYTSSYRFRIETHIRKAFII